MVKNANKQLNKHRDNTSWGGRRSMFIDGEIYDTFPPHGVSFYDNTNKVLNSNMQFSIQRYDIANFFTCTTIITYIL